MGIGGGPSEWDDFEWVRLAEVADPQPEPLTLALRHWAQNHQPWVADAGTRVLLVDLDNIRADPSRLRARLAIVLVWARSADVRCFAGQRGAVLRARPWLAEYATLAQGVPDGADVADHVLLAAAEDVAGAAQFVVASNDNIFANLAARGPITVLSPGASALSDKLREVATTVVDLSVLERPAHRPPRPQPGRPQPGRPQPGRPQPGRLRRRARR